MPLYEYECEKCGARFEVIQRFSDSPIETCRVCDGRVHKLISPPAIQFKGTGWYITDYAKKNGTSPSPQTMPGTSESAGESKGASESKGAPAAPAAAGEAKKA